MTDTLKSLQDLRVKAFVESQKEKELRDLERQREFERLKASVDKSYTQFMRILMDKIKEEPTKSVQRFDFKAPVLLGKTKDIFLAEFREKLRDEFGTLAVVDIVPDMGGYNHDNIEVSVDLGVMPNVGS